MGLDVKTASDGRLYFDCAFCHGKGFLTAHDIEMGTRSGRIASNQPLKPGPCAFKCTDGRIYLARAGNGMN